RVEMATFLTSEAMNPALRARVERAVSPRARARFHAGKAGLPGPFAAGRSRLGWVPLFPGVAAGGGRGRGLQADRAPRPAVGAERASLGAALADQRAKLPAGHERFVATTDRFITAAALDPDASDLVEPALKGALAGWLSRPAVYVRLPVSSTRDV